MGQVFRTKLNIKSKKVKESLKQMAGVYRKIFNVGLDAQFYRMTYALNPENYFLTGTFLHKVIKAGEKKLYPYISKVDCGITRKATFNSNYSFKRWYYLQESRLPVYLSRKGGMGFATSTKIKVFYDHISIPKLGDIKLYEKGYIPQGKVYNNVTFSYDGKDWWVSLEASERSENTPKESLKGSLKISSDMEGNIMVGDVVFKNITDSENYLIQKKKYNKLAKKMKRQKEANIQYTSAGKRVVRTSRNMMKTRNRMQVVASKMKQIKKDYFRKVASTVARTKPETELMLSQYDVAHGCQGYLSRKLREADTKELMSMIKRKAESIGSEVQRYSYLLQIS